jgi:ribosomal protein L37E
MKMNYDVSCNNCGYLHINLHKKSCVTCGSKDTIARPTKDRISGIYPTEVIIDE